MPCRRSTGSSPPPATPRQAWPLSVVADARQDETARRLATIPGVGPVTASLIAATLVDVGLFESARPFAAWLGLVPRQRATRGKARLECITKTGNEPVRTLLVLGATSMRAARAMEQRRRSLAQRRACAPAGPAGHGGIGQQDGAHRPSAGFCRPRLQRRIERAAALDGR